MKEIKIGKAEQNQRLDKFLMKYLNTAPKSFLYKMLRKKRIKLNGKKAEGNEMIAEGDTLQLYLAEETMTGFMAAKELHESERHFGIVYEDDNLLIADKPAGLLSHPEKDSDRDTLIDQILYYLYGKGQYSPSAQSSFTPALCNRLDRNTSGMVIAGKNLAALQAANAAIAEKKLEKYYLTLVKGHMSKPGEISGYLQKDNETNQVRVKSQEGLRSKKAVTVYRPLRRGDACTLLEVCLVTGKTHQIRAHLASIGHPVIGDRKYGEEKINRYFKEEFALSHQFLHAYKLKWNTEEGFFSYLNGREYLSELPQNLNRIMLEIFK